MRRRQFLAVVGAAAAGSLAGCTGGPDRELPSTPGGAWHQHAADPANTAATDAAIPSRGNPAWDEGETHRAAALVADETVYTVDDVVEALDARTGEQLWNVDLDGDANSTPALGAGRLVVAAGRTVVALSPDDGTRSWSTSLSRPVQDAVTLASEFATGIATLPVGEAGLVALALDGGEERWADETVSPRPTAAGDDRVYVTGYRPDGDTGVLRALDPADGRRRWSVDLDSPDTAPVVLDDGILVADGGTLAVHNPRDGTRRDALGSFGDRIPHRPAVADGTAFVVTADGDLVAVDLADGTERWRADVSVDAGPSVGAEAVVVGARDLPTESLGGVLAIERTDGTPRWEHEIAGFDVTVSAPPTVADGAVYYSSNESLGVVALGDLPPLDTETESG